MKEVNKNIVISLLVAIVVAVLATALFLLTREVETGILIQQDAVLVPQDENAGLNIDAVTGGPVIDQVGPVINVGAPEALNNNAQEVAPGSNIQPGTAGFEPLTDSVTENRNQPSPNRTGEN